MESQNCCKIVSTKISEKKTREDSYLVDHHDSKKVTDGGKDETIHVVSNTFADRLAECIDEDLTNNEEEDTKGNMA